MLNSSGPSMNLHYLDKQTHKKPALFSNCVSKGHYTKKDYRKQLKFRSWSRKWTKKKLYLSFLFFYFAVTSESYDWELWRLWKLKNIIIQHSSQERTLHYHSLLKYFFFFQCVFKSPYTGNGLWARNVSYHFNVSAFSTAAQHSSLHFCKELPVCQTQLQEGVRGITVSPRWWGGQFCGYTSLTPATLWEQLLPMLYPQCTQKTPQQSCQMVWLGNNTPFVRKQWVLRRLWSVPRYDV